MTTTGNAAGKVVTVDDLARQVVKRLAGFVKPVWELRKNELRRDSMPAKVAYIRAHRGDLSPAMARSLIREIDALVGRLQNLRAALAKQSNTIGVENRREAPGPDRLATEADGRDGGAGR